MAETTTRHRSSPPYNPGVRELVVGKRKGAVPLRSDDIQKKFRGWHERGYLPHRDEPGLTQFVTFHLADSFPSTLRTEWEMLLRVEDDRERRRKLEAYLDRGRGKCFLRQAEVARSVEETFRHYHGQWFELLAWVIMPNHVHLLINVGNTSLSKIVKELKRYTTREVNGILQRDGRLWAVDYFDTYMRDAEQELKTRQYIENNPVKALLAREAKGWLWSSARFRDEFGRLSW